MSVSSISTGSFDSFDFEEDCVFEHVVRKHHSTSSEPLPFRELVKEIRRYSEGDEIISKHFEKCEVFTYVGSEDKEKVTVVIDDTKINFDPTADGVAHLKSAVLNAPLIIIQNVYLLEADNLELFHGPKHSKAMTMKMARWFLDFLQKRKKFVKVDAYYAGSTQLFEVIKHTKQAKKFIKLRLLSDSVRSEISYDQTVTGVGYNVIPRTFAFPCKRSIMLDASEVHNLDHSMIANTRGIFPGTKDLIVVMGGHPLTFRGLPPFRQYFNMNLESLSLCFDFIPTKRTDTNGLTEIAINIVSRLLNLVCHARPSANINACISILMFFIWDYEDPQIDEERFKQAVLNSGEVVEAMDRLRQSSGPTCVVAVDCGCILDVEKPSELLSVELPRYPPRSTSTDKQ